MPRTIRIEAEQRKKAGGPITDLRSGAPAFFYRGEAVLFELGLLSNGVQVQKADITTITVRFRNASGTLLSETIVSNSNLSASLTAQQWRQGNAALARVSFDASATSGLTAGILTMEIVAGGVVYLSGTIESATSAAVTPGDPPPDPVDDYYTKTEADALFEVAGASTANAATLVEIVEFLGGDTEGDGKHIRAISQSWSDAEKKIVRTNIGAMARNDNAQEIGGSSADINDQRIADVDYSMTIVQPAAEAYLRVGDLRVGTPYLLSIQQGYVVNWTSDFVFPSNEITFGNSTGDFAKKTWHPNIGEGFDTFEIVRDSALDGAKARVRRFRSTPPPTPNLDFMGESPYWTGAAFSDLSSLVSVSLAGTVATAAMAGSNFTGMSYDGSSNAGNYTMGAVTVARGFAIAMVFTAANSTGQRILFASNSMGVQIVADSDGMRLQAFGGASGSGLLIATAYNAAPVAFVAVIRPGSTGAYVITTDPTGGGQTASFTPTSPTSGYGRWGSESGGWTKGLACVVARTQIFRSGLNYDQARAVLDSLTSYYQIG